MMYPDCAFVPDRWSGALEMNQTLFGKNLMAQFTNIPGSLGLDLGARKDGELGVSSVPRSDVADVGHDETQHRKRIARVCPP